MSEAKRILDEVGSGFVPEQDVAAIRAKNPTKRVHDIGTRVQHRKILGGRLHDGEIGTVVRVEDHGAGQIAHYVMWPRKRKPEMTWGGNLEAVQ